MAASVYHTDTLRCILWLFLSLKACLSVATLFAVAVICVPVFEIGELGKWLWCTTDEADFHFTASSAAKQIASGAVGALPTQEAYHPLQYMAIALPLAFVSICQ